MPKNIFLFIVCGAKEHIDTLHFSLPFLKKYSKNEIWVITDSKRNEIPILHETIINVETPSHFDHHQASIYLKTGVYQFVPKGNNYCYLDTDVIAFNEEVDNIFDEFKAPIMFAPDHCTLPYFSPYALNCGCKEVFEEARERFQRAIEQSDPYSLTKDQNVLQLRSDLYDNYSAIKSNFLHACWIGLKYVMSRDSFKLNETIFFDKKERLWKNQEGLVFMKDHSLKKISKKSGLKWNYLKSEPQLKDGRSIWNNQCSHLGKTIQEKFNISIKDKNFQHWNGGVFLFNDTSHDFLKFWHESTLAIFEDSYWKTRDQGTLIATVWKFGLQKHLTLDKKWNLIADYYKPELKWMDAETVQLNKKERVQPDFVHVYHHFGDENWEFWNKLIDKQS